MHFATLTDAYDAIVACIDGCVVIADEAGAVRFGHVVLTLIP